MEAVHFRLHLESMSSSQFIAGARRSIPILISTAPFRLLYGALAVDQGLTVWQAGLMILTLYAGASKPVGLHLFRHHHAAYNPTSHHLIS